MRRFRILATGMALLLSAASVSFPDDDKVAKTPVPVESNEKKLLETFEARHLAEQLEALSRERIKIEQDGGEQENLILNAADDRRWAARLKRLSESVRHAQQATDLWDRNVLPLETNDEGKVIARHDALVMAYVVQVERAKVAQFRALLQQCNRSLQDFDVVRGETNIWGIGLVDDLTEKLLGATFACNAARRQIERYAREADSVVIHGESAGPLAAVPNLQAAAASLGKRQLEHGLAQLKTRKIQTEFLKQNDHLRFANVMSGELAVLYESASYLRRLPETIEGRLGYSRPILLQFTARIGCEFRGKVHFFDKHGKYVTSVWADGFCHDKRFRLDTVEWVNEPPKGNSFSLGYLYEGTIEAKEIAGQYFYKDSKKSSGDFSFNTTQAFVFSSDANVAETGDK